MNKPIVANIYSIGGMTRSGRFYALAVVEMIPLNPTKELPKSKKSDTNPDLSNEPIIKKDASEFLKFIKHREYSVVE